MIISHGFDVCVCDIIIMILMSTAAAMRSVMAIVRVTSKELTVIIVIAIIIDVIIIVIMNIDGTNRLKAVLSAVRQRFCFQLHREAGGAAKKNLQIKNEKLATLISRSCKEKIKS